MYPQINYYLIINFFIRAPRPDYLRDSGPFYFETPEHLPNNLIIEPWNAFSSLLFWLPVIYWLIKLRGAYHKNIFMLWCMFLMATGGTGSFIFHGFRASNIWLYLDFVPIIFLTLSVSLYFWYQLKPKWWVPIVALVVFTAPRFGLNLLTHWPAQAKINLNYFFTGTMIFLPLLIIEAKVNFKGIWLLIIGIASFGLALFFRFYDDYEGGFLPMGVHWLWHVFTTVGAFPLSEYIYRSRKK